MSALEAMIEALPGSIFRLNAKTTWQVEELDLYLDAIERVRGSTDLKTAALLAWWGVGWANDLPASTPAEDRYRVSAKAAMVWGGMARLRHDLDEAHRSYRAATRFLEKRGKRDRSYVEIYGRIALLRNDERRHDEALEYMQATIRLSRKHEDQAETGRHLVGLGAIAYFCDQDLAKEAFAEALQSGLPDFLMLAAVVGSINVDLDRGDEVSLERLEMMRQLRPNSGFDRIQSEWAEGRVTGSVVALTKVEEDFGKIRLDQYAAMAKFDRLYELYAAGYDCFDLSLELINDFANLGNSTEPLKVVRLLPDLVRERSLTKDMFTSVRRDLLLCL